MKKMLTWAMSPPPTHSLQILTVRGGGTVLPHWRNEFGWARENPWGLVEIVTLQSTAHCTAGSPTFTVQEPRRISWWLEKGKASPSSPSIRGKVGAKLLMTQREARNANQANRMDPSPSPHPPSHNWEFLLERLWFSSHLDLRLKLLNGERSEQITNSWLLFMNSKNRIKAAQNTYFFFQFSQSFY